MRRIATLGAAAILLFLAHSSGTYGFYSMADSPQAVGFNVGTLGIDALIVWMLIRDWRRIGHARPSLPQEFRR